MFVTKVKKSDLLCNRMIKNYLQCRLNAYLNLKQDQIMRVPVNLIREVNGIYTILNRNLIDFDTQKSFEVNVANSSSKSCQGKVRVKLAKPARYHGDRHFRNVLKSNDRK